jgi:outer membrane protein insertion porin family
VIFRIREGADTIIKNVRFIGNDHIGSRSLRWTMEDTRRWWIFSWATGKGRLHDDKFEEDLDKLRDRYRELGYLDVEIDRSKVKFEYPRPGKMVIVIPINEGRRYKLGRMGFTGNKLYPARFLSLALNERPGNWFSPKKLQTDAEAVEEYYGKGGYLDTRVRVIRKPNVKTGNIDVDFGITEGEKVTLESIKIEGNDKTKSVVIIRELNLVPGMPFDSIRMKSSKLRLENTRFFEDVNLTPEETKVPGRRNLKVKVTEGKTGNLTFGAGYSTLEKAVFYTELTQGNFDITNRRSFFQGDGQKFRLRLQVGTVSNAINFGFEEPWVMQRPIAVGIELRRTSNSFTSSYYDIENLGGTVYARKRLFELVEGNLAYSYDIIRYKNISTTTRSLIDVLNDNSVSKVTFTLSRDTRNKLINTSSGGRVELTTEMAGGPLGADRNFYRIEARAAQFVPLFKDQEQVLSVLVRTGVIDRFGRTTDNDLYYYNYTLGGPNSLRGFDYREVGPRVDGLVWGGKTYGFISAEYSLDVVKPMRFALFYDAGFVNRDAYEWNPSGYVDNYGIGIRLMVMGSPMSLDYGIPLRTDRFNDSGGKFNFSYGTRF